MLLVSCILSRMDYVVVFLCPGCGLMFIAGQYVGRIACCLVVGIDCCVACCSCPVCGDPVSG